MDGADQYKHPIKQNRRITRAWRGFCLLLVKSFYRRIEVDGSTHIPLHGGALLCANHANALADALIIQAVCPHLVQPLARSGLFRRPWLRPILNLIHAIPIYRRRQGIDEPDRNIDSFSRVYRTLANGGLILIFPEGQSHADPKLRPFKTGAARMILGTQEKTGVTPALIPVGLNFTRRGRFRSSVFVDIGKPVDISHYTGGADETTVRAITTDLETALSKVTINVDNWDEFDLLRRIERFFAMRHGKYRKRSVGQRFQAMKKLLEAYKNISENYPLQAAFLAERLREFESLRRSWNIRDYHLTVDYTFAVVARFIFRLFAIIFVVLPLALWGSVTSLVPFVLTALVAKRFAHSYDQYDTATMGTGLIAFTLFWGMQLFFIFYYFGIIPTLVYAGCLPFGAVALVYLRSQRKVVWENFRVFILFMRKRELRDYLRQQKNEIEKNLAQFVRKIKHTNK